MADPKTFDHDDKFPANVNPTEENRKAFSEQFEKDRKAAEKGNEPEGARIGEGIVGEVDDKDTSETKGTSETASRKTQTKTASR